MTASFEPSLAGSRSTAVGALATMLSLGLHASALLSPAHPVSAPLLTEPDAIEVAIEPGEPERTLAPEARVQKETESAPLAKPAAQAVHRHSYPVPPSHDRTPHDPAVLHAPWPANTADPDSATVPVVTPAPLPEPARFAMRVRAEADSAANRAGNDGGGRTASANASVSESALIFAESAVDAPARLLASVPLSYPDAARANEREADVALELVVGSDGQVVSARALSTPGSGFESEALRAVRRYRFSAALRAGRPVSVRMRWIVNFRLR
ncbi:MAG TPA: TonB family protein [Polyangiaceae bacterium]|nr:TonB family protein [Polyangiaceae bacterium]